MTPNPQDSAVALEVERAKFEAWMPKFWSRESFKDDDGGTIYCDDLVQGAWIGFAAGRASQSDGTSGGVKACLFAQTAELMRAIDAYAYDYREFGKLAPSRHTVQIAVYDALNKFQGENHVG